MSNAFVPSPSENDPHPHSWVPEQLESACLQHGLILLETLQQWHQQGPPRKFAQLILEHLTEINENRWIEMIASRPDLPLFHPLGSWASLAPKARTNFGRHLLERYLAMILQDGPLLIIGLLDPWQKNLVIRELGQHLPETPFFLISLTPHSFSRLQDACENETIIPSKPWAAEELKLWCRHLHYTEESFSDLDALVEDLWLHSPAYPVLLPGSHKFGELIPGEDLCLVLQKTATHAWVGSVCPTDELLVDRLYQKLHRQIHLVAVGPREFGRLWSDTEAHFSGLAPTKSSQSRLVVRDWTDPTMGAPTEDNLLRSLLNAAIEREASDIHLEPKTSRIQVRFRIHGELIVQAPLARPLYPPLLRRTKILSGMRQDQVGCVQDGAMTHIREQTRYDCRTSITILQGGAEALVIRIFSSCIPKLADLQLSDRDQQTLTWCLDQENGLLLVTGPTGSGKTTTLYACLEKLSQPTTSIVTIEQPVEKHLSSAKQIEVRSEEGGNGLSFANALRSVLRQDPDIIMIGEIRDQESAQIAVQAALTGHLVLSSIHANDAVGVIERLVSSFGIDRITLAYALKLAVAQRLVSRLCPHCRRSRLASAAELRAIPEIGVEQPLISERVGCPACRGTGRSGRIAIMEMLPLDQEIVNLLEKRASPRALREYNQRRGFTNLAHQAARLLLKGEISLEEASSFLPLSTGPQNLLNRG